MCLWPWCFLLRRRILWLNIRGKDAAIQSMFHFSTPLPQVSGCVGVGELLRPPPPRRSLWGFLFTTQGP